MMIKMGNENVLNNFDFTQITHPATISVGDNDKMVSIEESLNVSNLLSNGRNLILTDTGHPVEKVNFQILAGEIRSLLTN